MSATATITRVKCGNHKKHGRDVVYHDSVDAVRECCMGQPEPVFARTVCPICKVSSAGGRCGCVPQVTDEPGRIWKVTGHNSMHSQIKHWQSIPTGGRGYGYFALNLPGKIRFFRVHQSRRGFVTVQEQAGGNFYDIDNRGFGYSVMTQIADDPIAAGLLYAEKMRRCYRCSSPLTDADSRARGLGPDCAQKV